MIDQEVLDQLRALSEQNEALARRLDVMDRILAANNANLTEYMEAELAVVRDAANRATQTVAQFSGKLDNFTDEQNHFKGDFSWWSEHLDRVAKATEAVTRKMEEAEARLELDNNSFKEWVQTKITQIGRIFRR